ncbi:hypothetical protein DEO72_LG6g1706 [Vigna unguiculata]|uniref:Uncharacterized protein n=1 Tax=Vigna unguiculata TaxID=3917 RepID=A0A4D6MA74_VIGUN|nr:hypothetical protein DEO72_LG6g1706 [Vigna unguiculata]
MAGLQQYNFFPTDLLYPRPQPQQASPKTTVLPLKNPNPQDHTHQQQHHQQQPRTTSALVYTQNKESLVAVHNNVSKFASDPLSWLLLVIEEDQQQNASDSS